SGAVRARLALPQRPRLHRGRDPRRRRPGGAEPARRLTPRSTGARPLPVARAPAAFPVAAPGRSRRGGAADGAVRALRAVPPPRPVPDRAAGTGAFSTALAACPREVRCPFGDPHHPPGNGRSRTPPSSPLGRATDRTTHRS